MEDIVNEAYEPFQHSLECIKSKIQVSIGKARYFICEHRVIIMSPRASWFYRKLDACRASRHILIDLLKS